MASEMNGGGELGGDGNEGTPKGAIAKREGSEVDVPSGSARSRPGFNFGAAVVIAILAFTVFSAVTMGTLAYHLSQPKPEPDPAPVIRRGPSVITAVRDLARLESAEFHVEKVIELKDTQRRLMGMLTAEDAMLLVAAGDVVAGVDLTKLRDGDVVVNELDNTVQIRLPRAEVFSARLDARHTYVHSRKTDTLARRNEQLEARARVHAEEAIEEAAVSGGILKRADRNARAALSTLVRAMGFEPKFNQDGER